MRLTFALFLAVTTAASNIVAFSFKPFSHSIKEPALVTRRGKNLTSKKPKTLGLYNDSNDCGCNPTLYSGKPLQIARDSNPREAIRYGSILALDSVEVRIDDLLENEMSGNSVSIVIFLRSLG